MQLQAADASGSSALCSEPATKPSSDIEMKHRSLLINLRPPPRGPNGFEEHILGRLPPARQAEGDDRTGERERRDDGDRGREPVEEGVGRGEAAGTGEHRDGDRDPEDTAELAHHAVGAGGLADILEGEGADDRVLRRRDRHRDPDAGDDRREHELASR